MFPAASRTEFLCVLNISSSMSHFKTFNFQKSIFFCLFDLSSLVDVVRTLGNNNFCTFYAED